MNKITQICVKNQITKILLLLISCTTGLAIASSSSKVLESITKFEQNHPQVKIKIKNLGFSSKKCDEELSVRSKLPINPSKRWILKVTCGNKWRANISVETSVLYSIPTATALIKKGDLITSANYIITKKWHSSKKYPITISSKHQATRTIERSQEIVRSMVEELHDLKKGSNVTVESNTPGILIRVDAVLLTDANIGDIVKAKNSRSKKTIKIKIISMSKAILY